jgi:ribosomal protein S18 acetylase RimI-like enzyme
MGTLRKKMIIVKLDQKSPYSLFMEVACLHITEIHSGFFSLLGEVFLSRFYYEITQLPTAGLWIAEENGKVLGFILGTSDFGKSYADLFKKAWFTLLIMGVRPLLKKGVLKKLPSILAFPFHTRSGSNTKIENPRGSNAELLSIAVHTDAKGRGIGKALVFAFEQALVEWGQNGLYFVTTNSDDPDSNAFYRKIGFNPIGKQKHNDLILQVYQKEIPIQKQDS